MCCLDDGRYFNFPSYEWQETPNVEQCKDDKQGTCASRDIAAGEELLQNYHVDDLDDETSEKLLGKILWSSRRWKPGRCNESFSGTPKPQTQLMVNWISNQVTNRNLNFEFGSC